MQSHHIWHMLDRQNRTMLRFSILECWENVCAREIWKCPELEVLPFGFPCLCILSNAISQSCCSCSMCFSSNAKAHLAHSREYLATKLQQEMHTRCHFHYFCKYHITWNQVCIHLLIFFSNIINYSTFFVYLQYCFALQISSSVEYCPFFLQFFLLFLNPRDFSVGIITHVDVEFSSQGVLQTIKSKIKGIRGREEKNSQVL